MHIEHKRVIDLSQNELTRCRELSFGDEGYMCEDLSRINETESARKQYRYSRAVLAYGKGRIVGWALIQPVYHSPKYSTQLFVDPAFRRQGIGGRLLKAANRYGYGKPYVYEDNENKEFFSVFSELCIREG